MVGQQRRSMMIHKGLIAAGSLLVGAALVGTRMAMVEETPPETPPEPTLTSRFVIQRLYKGWYYIRVEGQKDRDQLFTEEGVWLDLPGLYLFGDGDGGGGGCRIPNEDLSRIEKLAGKGRDNIDTLEEGLEILEILRSNRLGPRAHRGRAAPQLDVYRLVRRDTVEEVVS
jgi:hypothetical protein